MCIALRVKWSHAYTCSFFYWFFYVFFSSTGMQRRSCWIPKRSRPLMGAGWSLTSQPPVTTGCWTHCRTWVCSSLWRLWMVREAVFLIHLCCCRELNIEKQLNVLVTPGFKSSLPWNYFCNSVDTLIQVRNNQAWSIQEFIFAYRLARAISIKIM